MAKIQLGEYGRRRKRRIWKKEEEENLEKEEEENLEEGGGPPLRGESGSREPNQCVSIRIPKADPDI